MQSNISRAKSLCWVYVWGSEFYPCLSLHVAQPLLRQCIFSCFGGEVDLTGEILHGKTSPLRHDGRGLFAGLSQDIPVTRYHSLAGTHSSLPECLEVSSWIASGPNGGKGIIMGVRHKELLVEGVQFHPESILTAEGMLMLKNFLRMKGGTWKENSKQQVMAREEDGSPTNVVVPNGANTTSRATKPVPESGKSILEEIYAHRKAAVDLQKTIPSHTMSDLQSAYTMDLAPPLISFSERLRRAPYPLALAAEVKRASPSKGDIAPFICAPAQAKKYALAGASVISVLTEPKWFKGSIDDLRAVRQSLAGMPDRPAVLRKEFIFDEYQILEARLAGADTVLLIVKMLSPQLLRSLYEYSKSLGMEPLVEINTPQEMDIALELEAKVIGINNRNLTNFEVDLGTTNRLMKNVPKETIICALSGISGPKDVEPYKKSGVGAVLVGEALMKHDDTVGFVKELMGIEPDSEGSAKPLQHPLVKICGTRTARAAQAAVESGADMIGIIMVPGRKRTVATDEGLEISRIVHQTPKGGLARRSETENSETLKGAGYFDFTVLGLGRGDRALLVGVFQNQPLTFVLSQQRLFNLDVVQLHGSEPIEWASLIPVPVIRRFAPGARGIASKPYHALPLLDSAIGGSGERLDLVLLKETLKTNPGLLIALAGGLDPTNVASILSDLRDFSSQIAAVDVSSGVEEDGHQSLEKIRDFVKAVKTGL